MGKDAKNTRKHKRMKSFYLLKYQAGADDGDTKVTNVSDLSAGGLRFHTPTRLPEGTKINLAILVPSFEKPIETEAEVVWVGKSTRKENPYSVAVKFINISKKSEEALDDFVKKITGQKKSPLFIDLSQFGIGIKK